ncbi:hypothetical protein [Streptomyces sp. NPDC051921]|uniref:hypothetical protein n=1 Tax=Streptomyces sp. NPDC051921 TaxID=3155806 RepID=UPI00342E813B
MIKREKPFTTRGGDHGQKNPSFFGEYDTSRFFVCWWCVKCSPDGQGKCPAQAFQPPLRSGNGPDLGHDEAAAGAETALENLRLVTSITAGESWIRNDAGGVCGRGRRGYGSDSEVWNPSAREELRDGTGRTSAGDPSYSGGRADHEAALARLREAMRRDLGADHVPD